MTAKTTKQLISISEGLIKAMEKHQPKFKEDQPFYNKVKKQTERLIKFLENET